MKVLDIQDVPHIIACGLVMSLILLAAILFITCSGIGTSIPADDPYGLSGTGTPSGDTGASASRQPPKVTAGDLLTLSNAGDAKAIVALMTIGNSGIGNMSASGLTEVIFNAEDIGLPNEGSVTLSIMGKNIAYEETAKADDDGNITFTVPFMATDIEVTVTVTVANKYDRAIWLGSRQITIQEKFCDIAVTMTSTTPADFVYVEGNETIQDFYACMHEVTQGEYEQYCGYGGATPTAQDKGVGSDYPAYSVNWYDAILYCNIRSKMEGLTPCYSLPGGQILLATSSGVRSGSDGKPCGPNSDNPTWDAVVLDTSADGYRLPTDDEWVYAAKSGKANDNYTYSGSNNLDDVGWYSGNASGKSHSVKTKAPNSLGVYDMSGNVYELCWDLDSGVTRVQRGGGYSEGAARCPISRRITTDPWYRGNRLGFRVVRSAN